jgi:hypothetical protein
MLISLKETLAFPELKYTRFVLSGECFASGNIYQTYEILKLIFEVWIVCLIFYQDKSFMPRIAKFCTIRLETYSYPRKTAGQ